MKNTNGIIFFLLLLLGVLSLRYSLQAEELSDTADHSVTVSEYCQFLNSIIADDTAALYDEKMEIIRSGMPGSYIYEPILGKEGNSVIYRSSVSTIYYQDWSKSIDVDVNSNSDQNAPDPLLKSNHVIFSVKKKIPELVKAL